MAGNNPWLVLMMFLFSITMVTFAYTWLSVASRGSAMLATIFHGSTNWFANRMRPSWHPATCLPSVLPWGQVGC